MWADRQSAAGEGPWQLGLGQGPPRELLGAPYRQGLIHHFHLVGSLLPGGLLLPTPLQPPQTWALPESLCPKGRAGGAPPHTGPTCSIQGPQGPCALGRAGSRPGGAARPPSRSFPGCLQDAGLCPEAEGDCQPGREGRVPTEASYWFSRPRFCDRCSPAPTPSLTTVDARLPRASVVLIWKLLTSPLSWACPVGTPDLEEAPRKPGVHPGMVLHGLVVPQAAGSGLCPAGACSGTTVTQLLRLGTVPILEEPQ